MRKPDDYEDSFPSKLWEHERAFLAARRAAAQQARDNTSSDPPAERDPPALDPTTSERPPGDVTGVALSGGGIRSATFCLGVFQALAKHRLLGRIDYLSTVSGGGYFGSFLGALFGREKVDSVRDVEEVLSPGWRRPSPTASSAARRLGLPDVLRWLRENGRYLSPNGSGDLLIGGAIMFRNWIAIHVVLLTLALLTFLFVQLLRAGWASIGSENLVSLLVDTGSRQFLWWSPFLVLPVLPLLLVAVPSAWAYWMIGATKQPLIRGPVAGLLVVAAAAGACVFVSHRGTEPWWLGWVVIVEAGLALVWWFAAWSEAKAAAGSDAASGSIASTGDEGFVAAEERNLLSHSLLVGLLATAGLLLVGLVDSVAQSLYLAMGRTSLVQALGGLVAGLAGAASVGRRIAVALGRGVSGGKRVKLPMALVAGAAAATIIGLMLLSVAVLSHAVAWRFEVPATAPKLSWPGQYDSLAPQTATPVPRDVWLLVAATGVTLLLSFLFGRTWPFLNHSSLHAMYSARLTRAYLGASNPLRATGAGEAVTRVRAGDNFSAAEYWAPPVEGGTGKAPCQKGAPLHLINVTVNETVDGRSQVQQQDRKGMGLAIGPYGVSVGTRHHAIFPSHRALADKDRPARVTVAPAAEDTYRVFDSIANQTWLKRESLTVGQWVGISGAAFSTGLGARTSLGLSLLCGFANVRLGYWWESGVEPPREKAATPVEPGLLERLFPLQMFMLKEFVSQFPGTAYTRWYLSDGGHFENMGGYELIRRRLPRMLIVDAEADPEYRFEGLANFVRKARLDFGAEIRFLDAAALTAALPKTHRHLFGSLEELRRGRWADEPVSDPLTKIRRLTIDQPVDQTRYSRAHAALATVKWPDEPRRTSWLLYLKPTLTGDEPYDVLEYHRGHVAFPQETTADQFFDEAQWESYRMLGFEIAEAVFGPGLPEPPAEAPGTDRARSPRQVIFGGATPEAPVKVPVPEGRQT